MEQTIEFQIPEGYVFDKDNSTENVIRFKPIKKKVTYEDIIKKLYPGKCYYINNNHTSERQISQLLYLNKLMNVAKYLNGDWEPDWNNTNEDKFYICCLFGKLSTCKKQRANHGCAAFKSEKLAYQAIEILGEEAVKIAFGVFD